MNKKINLKVDGKQHICENCNHAVSHTINKKSKDEIAVTTKKVLFTYGCPRDCQEPNGKEYKTKDGTKKFKHYYGYSKKYEILSIHQINQTMFDGLIK